MNWTSIRAWLGTVIRLVLGVVWFWAGWSEMRDPRGFVQAVRAYDATPEWLSKAIGYGLPVLELSVGVLLIAGVITRIATAVSGVLLLVFIIGVAQAGARDIKLECGCFGGGGATTGSTSYTLDILRDVGLLVLAVFLVLWPLTRLGVDEFLSRHDEIAPPSAKRMRTPDGKRKYNALLEARKKEARSRTLYLTASLGLVVVLVSVIGIGVQANRAKIQGDLTAANATVKNGVVVGKAAPVTLDVFEDFQCPICQQLESSAGSDISSQISAGKIQVRYHIMSFLDSASNGNRYSSRAANAALCASDVDVSRFQQYHNLLYGKDSKGTKIQPAEDGNGRTDAQFVNYAAQIGIKDSGTVTLLTTFKSCVQGEKHKALVQAITDNASKRDVTGTPTILVNGKKLSNPTKASLDAAILAASAKAPKSTSTPTPSTSASTSGTATKSPSGSGSATP